MKRVVLVLVVLLALHEAAPSLTCSVDPLTRYIHITYEVPAGAPDEAEVSVEWANPGTGGWRPACVWPLLSETGMNLAREEDWRAWTREGRIVERRAAGLERTAVFNPYPEAQRDGRVDVEVRVTIRGAGGAVLAEDLGRAQADNADVVYLEDWSRVMQAGVVAVDPAADAAGWAFRTSAGEASLGNDLAGNSAPELPLTQLTFPLDLRGTYALYVVTDPAKGAMRLRLTGDERSDLPASRFPREEVFWRWTRMDRQHLVLAQPHYYKGYVPAQIDYVKLVPLSDGPAAELEARYGGAPDKVVGGYWEPYSWAFYDNVQSPLQHREPLDAFAEACISIVDTQINRFGMKSVFETRTSDQLIYSTIGDPVAGDNQPLTDNVGRMQQYTNTLDATLRYTRELGLRAHANFGASNCYPGSPLQGDFSKAHPDWMRGSALRYEVPEVRAYVLAMYREALEIGAPGLSLDFCRYPETVDSVETGNAIMRELRGLANEFADARGGRVPILVRFPGTGVRRAEFFDYATWAREGWVDYLCPSNIQGRHHHIDMTPYLAAVQGTKCMLLPCIDGLEWGVPTPGPFLWRVQQLYDLGVPGVYVYQADGRILGRPGDRRCMRMLASSAAVRQFWAEDAALRPQRSKGIYLSRPADPGPAYHGWERIRIWVEGVPFGPLETYIDGQLVGAMAGPPYLVGTEDYASDGVLPAGTHELTVRVRDGDDWLEQHFTIESAG